MMAFILATDFDFIAYMSKMAFFWKIFSRQWRFWNLIDYLHLIGFFVVDATLCRVVHLCCECNLVVVERLVCSCRPCKLLAYCREIHSPGRATFGGKVIGESSRLSNAQITGTLARACLPSLSEVFIWWTARKKPNSDVQQAERQM